METADTSADLISTPEVALTGAGATDDFDPGQKRFETLYFAFHNTKLVIGLSVVLSFLVLAIVGPWLTSADPFEFGFPLGIPPNSTYWLGTTSAGQDVYAQFVYGLRSSFVVGAIAALVAGTLGMAIGFIGGYLGGVVDDILSMLTNVVLVIPTLALLLVAAAYLSARGVVVEALFIGFTSWPWAARAIRAQTFSLRSREFVNLARMSGVKGLRIVFGEIAPNMSSYLFLTFILLFGGAILIAATLDFIGLGPTSGSSLGLMMYDAVAWSALQLGLWWWFIPPGVAITAIVGALYITNVGLDEVFNPKLRNT